jgi:hypothetical protein
LLAGHRLRMRHKARYTGYQGHQTAISPPRTSLTPRARPTHYHLDGIAKAGRLRATRRPASPPHRRDGPQGRRTPRPPPNFLGKILRRRHPALRIRCQRIAASRRTRPPGRKSPVLRRPRQCWENARSPNSDPHQGPILLSICKHNRRFANCCFSNSRPCRGTVCTPAAFRCRCCGFRAKTTSGTPFGWVRL